MRFQAASRLEVCKAMVTFMFQTHKMSLYVHSHVTFLFNFFMTLRTTPQHGCTALVHRFIHQTLQLCIKFCKKILSESRTQKSIIHHTRCIRSQSSEETPTFTPSCRVSALTSHLYFHHCPEPAEAPIRHSPDHPRIRRTPRTPRTPPPRNSRHPRPAPRPGLQARS